MFDKISIEELLDKQDSDLSAIIENGKHGGLGLSVHWILQHQIILEIAPCEESLYFSLPNN